MTNAAAGSIHQRPNSAFVPRPIRSAIERYAHSCVCDASLTAADEFSLRPTRRLQSASSGNVGANSDPGLQDVVAATAPGQQARLMLELSSLTERLPDRRAHRRQLDELVAHRATSIAASQAAAIASSTRSSSSVPTSVRE